MPKLNDHGLGGGGKPLGIPMYPVRTHAVLEDNYSNGEWVQYYGDSTATAPFSTDVRAMCNIDHFIYVVGVGGEYTAMYRYDILNRSWTKLTSTPTSDDKSWAVVIGSDIWYGAKGYIFKYSVSSNTHTQIASFPYVMQGTEACTDGEYIYIFGGGTSSTYYKTAYKFNISTTTFTQLTNIPVTMAQQGCVYDDGYVYLFGGAFNPTSAYKYSIANNTYTTLATIPFSYENGMIVKLDRYIYLINSYANPKTQLYAYNIYVTNGSYTALSNTPNGRVYGHAVVYDGVIYMMSGGMTSTTYASGDTMVVMRAKKRTGSYQQLFKGSKCYTDGDVYVGGVSEKCGRLILKGGSILGKKNGITTIPNDGKYLILYAKYATIGG